MKPTYSHIDVDERRKIARWRRGCRDHCREARTASIYDLS
ncbi:hypothetical protein FHX06_001893 [Rhizobium sp. BK512]|nr:hypothetical protein [Rhizobium sp. BK512]